MKKRSTFAIRKIKQKELKKKKFVWGSFVKS